MRGRFLFLFIGLMVALGLIGGGAASADLQRATPRLGAPLPFPTHLAPADQRQAPTARGAEAHALLPAIFTSAEPSLWLNTQDRQAVRQFYLSEYLASEGVSSGWSGDHASCDPGTTAAAFREAILRRINYFRVMSGIPPVTGFKAAYNQKAQAAALMMSVNKALDHTPPTTWTCYTPEGYEGASSSNLFLGVYGPAAITGYIHDFGGGNTFVGHRRWILYPQTEWMGSGDVPPQSGYPASNALWVFDSENMWGDRPQTREPYVAWPPPGYVPRQLLFPRWSFSYPQADFAATSVSVTRNNQPVPVTINPIANGFGENTVVWELGEPLPAGEVTYSVSLHNVIINAASQVFSYDVTVFDPTQ
jgi:hypothetical protein